jgi:hypothetical protein
VAEVFEVPLAFFLEPSNLRRYTMDFRGHRVRWWSLSMVVIASGVPPHPMLLNLLQRMGRA